MKLYPTSNLLKQIICGEFSTLCRYLLTVHLAWPLIISILNACGRLESWKTHAATLIFVNNGTHNKPNEFCNIIYVVQRMSYESKIKMDLALKQAKGPLYLQFSSSQSDLRRIKLDPLCCNVRVGSRTDESNFFHIWRT